MQKAPYVVDYLTAHSGDDAFQSLAGYRAKGGYKAAARALGNSGLEELRHLVAKRMRVDPSLRVVASCVEALATGWYGFGRAEILALAREAPTDTLRQLCLKQVRTRSAVDPAARAVALAN